MADRIQQRRDTAARWAQYNPILLEGEPGYEIDTDQYKLGDGVHAWNDLPYRGDPCLQQKGNSTTTPMSQNAVTECLDNIEDTIEKMSRTIDGGRADTKYGGLDTIDCGDAYTWV